MRNGSTMTLAPVDELVSDLLYRVEVNEQTGCWEWPWAMATGGRPMYGRTLTNGTKRTFLVHRTLWQEHSGADSQGIHLIAGCGNRRCVRPGDGHNEPRCHHRATAATRTKPLLWPAGVPPLLGGTQKHQPIYKPKRVA